VPRHVASKYAAQFVAMLESNESIEGKWPHMAHAVPSQVCNLILKIFPDLDTEPAEKGQQGIRRATDVHPVLDLLERIPDELIRLSADDAALFWANTSALRNSWEDRNRSTNQIFARPLSGAEHTSLFEIKRLLAKCPDEAPAVQTTGLEFLPDDGFREGLRTDMSSANSALMSHEYKAATVLAGSVVEALLLWALVAEGEQNVRAKIGKSAPMKGLNEWLLGQMIPAAHACRIISDDTRKQAELAQNFRNLIHPGRQARLQEICDRGTAHGALAAVERVAGDLAKKFPP
jgi:hypothetical protein